VQEVDRERRLGEAGLQRGDLVQAEQQQAQRAGPEDALGQQLQQQQQEEEWRADRALTRTKHPAIEY
jgi:hypothetical protein